MKPTKQPVTRLDYCQYLLSSQINYTLTHFADHTEAFSHDMLNRYLAGEQITPRLVWENVKEQVVQCASGHIVFDDTVVDKNYSYQIELVRRQYSGNAHGVIKGIGVVTCVYVSPIQSGTGYGSILDPGLPHLRSRWGWQDETGSCARHVGELCLP